MFQIFRQLSTQSNPRSLATCQNVAKYTGLQKANKLILYYNDVFEVNLPDGHRFPMSKYRETRLMLQRDPSLSDRIEFRQSPFATLEELQYVHDVGYINRFLTGNMTEKEMRNVGFPYSQNLVHRTLSSAGGTVAALHSIYLEEARMAGNIAGGTHHAFRDWGEGFCVFNDIAVAAGVAMKQQGISKILVIDLDVHQGNGTAGIFEGEQSITTFDMNGAKNYPWRTRRKNTYDVLLNDGAGDEEYLSLLERWLPKLEAHDPELIIYQAGVDALEGDRFGRLKMS
eukprot:TRINITY_DN50698_c0_g1_i2.p1 TRINITY_DN50698_c0_g1~~TRINITY_DN50698_c0_g1_i2.p1  ORF type:complete len:284 (-),score=31.37 TRINITY_DN50698_c0_g1_i2:95-946(-)